MDNDVEYVGTTRVTRSSKRRRRKKQRKQLPIQTYTIEDDEDVVEKKEKVTVDGWLDITLQDNQDEVEDEPIEEVKALWYNDTNKIERFSLKRSDPLVPVFEHFAKVNNVDIDQILIQTNSYKQIHHYDSIETLNFKVTNFLIVSLKGSGNEQTENDTSGENMIEVKCQFKDKKQPILCKVHTNQPFSFVAEQCATKLGTSVEKIKLFFDGDPMSLNDTPSSLDFEGGECIDVSTL